MTTNDWPSVPSPVCVVTDAMSGHYILYVRNDGASFLIKLKAGHDQLSLGDVPEGESS